MNLKELIKDVDHEDVLAEALLIHPETVAYEQELTDSFAQQDEIKPAFSYFDPRKLSGKIGVTNTLLGAFCDFAAKEIIVVENTQLTQEELSAYIVGLIAHITMTPGDIRTIWMTSLNKS